MVLQCGNGVEKVCCLFGEALWSLGAMSFEDMSGSKLNQGPLIGEGLTGELGHLMIRSESFT